MLVSQATFHKSPIKTQKTPTALERQGLQFALDVIHHRRPEQSSWTSRNHGKFAKVGGVSLSFPDSSIQPVIACNFCSWSSGIGLMFKMVGKGWHEIIGFKNKKRIRNCQKILSKDICAWKCSVTFLFSVKLCNNHGSLGKFKEYSWLPHAPTIFTPFSLGGIPPNLPEISKAENAPNWTIFHGSSDRFMDKNRFHSLGVLLIAVPSKVSLDSESDNKPVKDVKSRVVAG